MENSNYEEEIFSELFEETERELGAGVRKGGFKAAFARRVERQNRYDTLHHIDVEPSMNLMDNSETFQGIKAYDLDAFFDMKLPEKNNILHPWLPENGMAMVHSHAGLGKTFFALNVAFAVATGGEYLGWKANKACSVLYIDGEMNCSEMKSRLQAISGKSDVSKIPFFLITPDLCKTGMPDLSTTKGQYVISRLAEGKKLVVLDNLTCLLSSGKENEVESWWPIQRWLNELNAAGTTVLIIHHSSKSGGQRGSSAHVAKLDTVIRLKRPKGYSADQGAAFSIHFEKNRLFYGDDAKPITARLIQNDEGSQEWSTDTANDPSQPQVNETYEMTVKLTNEGLKQVEIAEKLEKSTSVISRYVKQGRQEGLIPSNVVSIKNAEEGNDVSLE